MAGSEEPSEKPKREDKKEMIWIILSVTVAVLFCHKFFTAFDYWKRHGAKQTKPLTFFGDNFRLLAKAENYIEYINKIYNMHPGSRYTGFYEFLVPVLLIKDPELIKQVTIKDFDHFTDHKNFIDNKADPMWEKNVFALTGQPWREMRLTLSGSFTSTKMKQMFCLMKDASENFVQYFLKKNEKVVEVEMKDTFTRFSNDIIATTAFGVEVDSLKHQNNEFYLMGKEATDIYGFWKTVKMFAYVLFPTLSKGLKVTFFSDKVRNFFIGLVRDIIKMREKTGTVRPDMINLLMEARKGTASQDENCVDSGFAVVQESPATGPSPKPQKAVLTDDDIAAQGLVFFFGGFHTVTTAMCFLAYELAVNPDIQCRLREEIKKAATECNGDLTYEVLLKMKYLDMVVSEGLRKWPSFINIDRICTKPYTIEPASPDEKPIHIRVGDEIWISPVAMHRDPKNYPNPEKFDPERFSDENKNTIKPYTYLPFGVGPRQCIASRYALMETKVVFFSILLNFEIVPTAKLENPIKLKKGTYTLTADKGFWFGLKRI